MGYRHQVISDTCVPSKETLPEWFTDKYNGAIDFDRIYWASYSEHKRYGTLRKFNEDIQKVLIEIDRDVPVRLIYFADESSDDAPDVIHALITKKDIKEIEVENWVKYEN